MDKPRKSNRHPFAFLPIEQWPRLFWVFLLLTIFLMVVFNVSGAPLTTTAAPYGVVSYELAGSVEQSEQILASWDANTQLRAAFGLGIDTFFMPVYASAIALGCGLAANALQRRRWPLAGLGNWLAWGAFLAALCDVVENVALTVILFGPVAAPWPAIAAWCASVKFLLIFAGIVYGLYGGVVSLVIRPARP
jgi:hypothetical protein